MMSAWPGLAPSTVLYIVHMHMPNGSSVINLDCNSFHRSHSGYHDPAIAPCAPKRFTDDRLEGEFDSKSVDPPTPDSGVDVGVSPSPPSSVESLSPEQRDRMAAKKFEAESKRVVAMVGASLGSSWLKALLDEFKKPYIKEVCMQQYMIACG